MKPKSIRLYVKSFCGWCREAKDWLDERGIAYDEINVSADRVAFDEMRRLTGQSKAPCIEVDGEWLADFGADELARWWLQNNFE